jgi:hypothetical protein
MNQTVDNMMRTNGEPHRSHRRYRNMAPAPRGWNGRPVATQAVSIMPDGSRKLFTAPVKTRATRSNTKARETVRDYGATYYDRVSQLGATGNVE